MPKVEIQALVQLLSNGQADPVAVEQEYQRLSTQLGDRPVLTQATIVSLTAFAPTFDLPEDAVRLLDLVYDARQLTEVPLHALDAVAGRDWRDEQGHPRAFTRAEESERTIRLYPIPVMTTEAPIFPFGAPMGDDYPLFGAVCFHTQRRTFEPATGGLDTPGWLDLWFALQITTRVYARESTQRDPSLALTCAALGQVVDRMVLGDA